MRHLVVGDIHGCGQELEKLIEIFNPQETDKIIFVGDLFDRAMDGRLVWNLIKKHKIHCCMGNHERKFLNFLKSERSWVPKHYDYVLEDFFNPNDPVCSKEEFIDFLENLYLIYQIDEQTMVTHAGVIVNNPLEENVGANVYGLLDPNKPMPKPWLETNRKYWWDEYHGDILVIYGHLVCQNNKPRIIKNSNGNVNSIGLDTAACHGGMLTGYILEENRFIQVKCKDWYGKLKQKLSKGS